ncbi:MAG: hypothetical protein CMO01_08215 [Thalassobius sp.]|nr:hypothetical protein [Thalassovita sp.]
MKTEIKQNNRFGWIDYARGIAIILVVYKHAVVGFISSDIPISDLFFDFQEMVYNLRMPLFFMLSGVFIEKSLRRRGVKEFVRYKINTIIYPFLIWGGIQISIQVIASEYTNSQKSFLDMIYLLYYPRLIDPFWFLYTLFFIVIIYALLETYFKIKKRYLFLLNLAFYFSSFYIKTDILCINDILFYSIFLTVGILFSKYLLGKKYHQHFTSAKLFLILGVVVFVGQWYWYTNYKGLVWFTDLSGIDRILFLPISILGSTFLLQLSFILDKYDLLTILRFIGSHSLYIYVMHLIVTGATRAVLLKLLGGEAISLSMILVIISGILMPILIYKITERLKMDFLYQPPKISFLKQSLQ